jgi:hypothetical protein
MNTRFVPCEVCGSEGRIYRQHVTNPYEEVDHGECPECRGSGMMEVEMQPVEMRDRIAPSRGCCPHGYDVDRGVLCPVCDS